MYVNGSPAGVRLSRQDACIDWRRREMMLDRGQPFPRLGRADGATLTQERFAGPDWIFERKLDGIRLLAFRHGRDVRLLSRNKLPQNAVVPEVAEAIARLPVRDGILDGEATGVWFKQGRIAYHIFDTFSGSMAAM
jgi:ATP-dependent DNA ligase